MMTSTKKLDELSTDRKKFRSRKSYQIILNRAILKNYQKSQNFRLTHFLSLDVFLFLCQAPIDEKLKKL